MMPKLNNEITFEALGTNWWVSTADTKNKKTAIIKTVQTIDKRWSRFRNDSLVTRIRKRPGVYTITPDEYDLFHFYHELYLASDGQVTPFIGQAMEDLGYDAQYSLKERHDPQYRSLQWDDVVVLEQTSLTIKQPVVLDVGAAGKGYAVDRVSELVGATSIIDASGDLKVNGTTTIGLQHPTNESQVIGQVTLTDMAMCASSIYARSWRDVHHVVDGKTGQPTREVVATWAIANDAMHADGLATALFFCDPEQLQSLGLIDYCIIYANDAISVPSSSTIRLFFA